jgi:AcrR family transcriptional regulator
MGKDDQRIRLTKRILKETLIEMLGESDLNKISVTALCSRAEINRSTFYQHYGAPKDVLLDIERDFSEKTVRLMKESDSRSSFEQRLTKVCSYIYENTEMQKRIFRNTPDDELARVFSDSGLPFWDTSAYFHTVESADEVSRALTSVFINYGSFHVIREWIIKDIHKTPAEIASIICSIAAGK